MPKRKLPQKATIPELTSHMLTSVMPTADDVRDCLMGLGVKPTCAAYIVFGMIQKAARGDTAAAKFLSDISQPDAPRESPDTASDLRALSDAELLRLAGLSPEGGKASKTNTLYNLLPVEKGDRRNATVDEVGGVR